MPERQKEKSCSWVEVRQPGEQLIPIRAEMSNRASATTLPGTEDDECPDTPHVLTGLK